MILLGEMNYQTVLVKGIVSDSNNIFLYDIDQNILSKKVISKFQLIPILPLQAMHDYVRWHWSID